MNSHIITANESKSIQSCAMTMFMVPVKLETEHKPEGGYDWYQQDKQGRWHQYTHDRFIDRAPFSLDQSFYFREPWNACLWDNQTKYYYPSDKEFIAEMEFLCRHDEDWELKFNSPATMPKSAARTWITITGVEVKRIRDITLRELMLMGYPLNDIRNNKEEEEFITKHGQSAWDNNGYIFLYTFSLKHSPH